MCNEGYKGRVCSGCVVGAEISQSFKKSSSGECSKCPEVWASVLSLFGVVIAFVAWMCFAIQLALRGAKNAAGRHSQLFKSLLSHVQVAALAKDFDLQYSVYLALHSSSLAFISFRCLFLLILIDR